MPDTIPGKHAVVLSLEDALTTGGAVPGSGRGDGLTDGTVMPVFSPARLEIKTRRTHLYLALPEFVAGYDDVSRAGVN